MQVHFGEVALRGRPETVEGTSVMYCPRRTVLDALLVDAARRAGAEIRERTVMRGLLREEDRVAGVRLAGPDGVREERARLVVGADGLTSGVARAVGAEVEREHPSLTCGFYAYWAGVPTDGVEFYLSAGCDVLAFPTHDGLTCLWVGRSNGEWPVYKADVEAVYRASLPPALGERLQGGRRATPYKGTHRLPNRYHACWGNGWALVGDAAYHRDPLTGMGIGDAFLGAQLLADALGVGLDGDLPAVLAGYRQSLWEQTAATFGYTLRSAALKDPAPLASLYQAIGRRPETAQLLMNIMAGSAPAERLFNPRTIVALTGGRSRPRRSEAS